MCRTWCKVFSIQSWYINTGLILPLVLLSHVSHAWRVKVYQHAYPALWSSCHGCLNSIFPLLTSSACAGLFEVCLFLPDESSSDISPPQLCLLLLGPASPNWTSVPIWPPGCCGCRLTFTNSWDTRGAKTTVMIFVNTLISQPFALHVVSVTFYLFLSSRPPASLCKHVLSLSLSYCSQFLCSNRKADQ